MTNKIKAEFVLSNKQDAVETAEYIKENTTGNAYIQKENRKWKLIVYSEYAGFHKDFNDVCNFVEKIEKERQNRNIKVGKTFFVLYVIFIAVLILISNTIF